MSRSRWPALNVFARQTRSLFKMLSECRMKLTSLLSASACAALCTNTAFAQAPADSNAAASVELPAVVVSAEKKTPKAKNKPKKKTPAPTAAAPTQATAPTSAQDPETQGRAETATGPVNGIVATRSATGTKTDTPLIETSQSVSVISAERMTQQGAVSVTQALGYTAGVQGAIYGVDTRFDWLNIRGFDAYLPGFFVDGMLARNNNTWSVWKVEPYGTERIEVLKGPPSVLYGQANAGGMVNVVSKRPLAEPLYETELRFGSHGRTEGLFDFSGPATGDGKVLYRLTGVLLDTDTQVDYTDQKRAYIAPAITWRPTSGTSLTLLGQYLKEDNVPNIGFLPAQGTLLPNPPYGQIPRSFFTGEPGYDKFEQEQWAAGYLFEHKVDDVWKVRQNLRYSEIDVDYKQVIGSTLLAPDSLDRYAFTSREHQASFVTDNQLQADFVSAGIRHTVLAGTDYQHNKYDRRSTFGGSFPINPYDPVYGATVGEFAPYFDGQTSLQQIGTYLQEQARYGGWVATLGGRYDWADLHSTDKVAGNPPDQHDEAFTWKGGLLYHAANGLAPYYSYSTSFFPTAGHDDITDESFKPETGAQHEIGIKYEIPNIKSLFTVAAFDIKRQNYITSDHSFRSHQTGEIHSQGIEFEGSAELAPGLDLISAYTWLPTFEATKSSNPDELFKRVPITPEHAASLWLHYKLQGGPLAGFGFGGGVRYIGETYGNIANDADMRVPDFTLFDAVVDYEIEGWRFAVNVSNIADETTFNCWDTCYYGAGREILASIRHRW